MTQTDQVVDTIPESTDVLQDAFARYGVTSERLTIGGTEYVRFTGKEGWIWLTPYTFVSYPFVLFAAIRICRQKQLTYEYAAAQGVAVPISLLVSESDEQSRQAFLERYAPLVVKPTNSNGSKGLTLNVDTPELLKAAIATAEQPGSDVLLQRQFEGQEFRFTILRGKVVSVIWRQTPQVVGDGVTTIAELLRAENELRRTMVFPHLRYPQLTPDIIDGDFLSDQRVPAAGEVVELGKGTSISSGSSRYNVTDVIDDSYKRLAAALARGLSPDFLVVDCMIADHLQPATPDNYIFLECNTSPSLKMYYSVRDGKTYDIADDLVRAIIAQRSSLVTHED